jgi:hypothetical protein
MARFIAYRGACLVRGFVAFDGFGVGCRGTSSRGAGAGASAGAATVEGCALEADGATVVDPPFGSAAVMADEGAPCAMASCEKCSRWPDAQAIDPTVARASA